MSVRFAAQLAPVIGGFVAWMLSGSPVPMVFAIGLIFSAFLCRKAFRADSSRFFIRLLLPFLALAAAVAQVWLFRNGQAMAISADLPLLFHFGLALLWAVAMEFTVSRNLHEGQPPAVLLLCGLAGSLVFLAVSLATELYDFNYWQVYPLAALPFVLFVLSSLFSQLRPWSFGFAAGISAAVVAAFALTLERGTDQLSEWLRTNETDLADLESSRGPRFDSSTGGPDGSSRRLPRKANIRFDDRIHLFLKTESPDLFRSWMKEPLYLRTSTVTVFQSDEVIAPIRSGRWIYDIDDGKDDNTIAILPGKPSSVHQYTLFIEREAAHALPLLRGSNQVNTSALYEFADSWYQLAPTEETKRLRFTAATTTFGPRSLNDLSINALQRPSGPGIYLNLPPSPLAGRVSRMCDSFEMEQSVNAIREHLEARASYSLNYETPENMSPVESLLFGERRGHCELYAAASVMMLRSIGIPCRLAYGYTGGLADRKQRLIAFRDRDFHAWAEILDQDNQWVVFDATPTTENATRRLPAKARLAEADWSSYENFSTDETSLLIGDFSLFPGITAVTAFLSRHFLTLTWSGLAVAGLFWWTRQSRRKSSSNSLAGSSPSSDRGTIACNLMAEIESCGEGLGVRKQQGLTWKEFLNHLQRKTSLPDCFPDSILYYYRVRYAGAAVDSELESNLRSRIQNWKLETSSCNDESTNALTN